MASVWEYAQVEGAELLVLLCLADHANDEGVCYPSVTRLALRSRLSLRGVQTALRSLEKKGLLQTEANAGPKGCNRYTVTPATSAPLQNMHPAASAPRNMFTPADNDTTPANGGIKPPQHLHPNHKEPSKNRHIKATSAFVLPEWVPKEAWDAYIEVRKLKKYVMSDHALELLVGKLDKMRGRCNIEESINDSIVAGWRSFFEPKENRNGTTRQNGFQTRSDRNLEELRKALQPARGGYQDADIPFGGSEGDAGFGTATPLLLEGTIRVRD